MNKFFVEVVVHCADANETDWYSVEAANADEAAARVKNYIKEYCDYNIGDCAIGAITEHSPIIDISKTYYVNVGVNCEDNIDYEWYSVKAVNAIEAEDKVCEWLEENTNYANCCAIECVRENKPNLITAID